MDSFSAPGRYGGREKRVQRERELSSTGEILSIDRIMVLGGGGKNIQNTVGTVEALGIE